MPAKLKNNMRSRQTIKQILHDAFRRKFPDDTVDISDGYQDNIHVLIVSRKFDSMTENEKQELLWKIVDNTKLNTAEKQLISLIYPLSVAELK